MRMIPDDESKPALDGGMHDNCHDRRSLSNETRAVAQNSRAYRHSAAQIRSNCSIQHKTTQLAARILVGTCCALYFGEMLLNNNESMVRDSRMFADEPDEYLIAFKDFLRMQEFEKEDPAAATIIAEIDRELSKRM